MDSENNTFQILLGNSLPQAGQPLVILAADNAFSTLYSEYYVFILSPLDKTINKFDGMIVSLLDSKDSGGLLKETYDLNGLIEFAREGAQGFLNNYLFELYNSTKNLFFVNQHFNIHNVENGELFRFHLKYGLKKELAEVFNKSKSKLLKEYISEFMDYPKIGITENRLK